MRIPYHYLAGAALAASFVWLAIRPGWGTFAVFFAALILWGIAFAVHLAGRALRLGKRAYNRVEDHLLGAEPQPVLSPEAEALIAADPELARLRRDLLLVGQDPALADAATRARRQLLLLPQILANLDALLQRKLNPDEITYARYRDAGREAYATVRREIDEIAGRMRSIYTPGARRRPRGLLGLLFPRVRSTAVERPMLDAMQQEQLRGLAPMLEASERGLDEMVRMNVAVSQMRGRSGREDGQLQELMHDLDELSQRARRY